MKDKIVKALMQIIWPLVQELLRKYAKELLAWLDAKIRETIRRHFEEREKAFRAKAEDAKNRAASEPDPAAAEKVRVEAETWEAALQVYKAERDRLLEEFSALHAEAATKVDRSTSKLDVEQAFEITESEVLGVRRRPLLDPPSSPAT